MIAREIAALVALFVGTGIIVLSSIGLLLGDAYDRLHFAGAASMLAPWLLAAAVALRFSLTEAVIKGILLAAVIFLASPVLTHATARNIHDSRRRAAAQSAAGSADAIR